MIDTPTIPYLIAGPCSVESEQQIHSIAVELKQAGVTCLRGGIWKPRSLPGSFQGIGSAALPWLKQAASENGLLCATEVATAEQCEEALKMGIDILWIGARSTVSPFVVQEIADALQGSKIPVMIKNPINPDLELWCGGIERLQKAGIQQLSAVHRGFSSYEKKQYRNVPNWEIPLELKRRYPDIRMICDPSHISGKRELIAHVAQLALDLNFEGLMIEVHNEPDKALSDKEQQITPANFAQVIQGLIVRTLSSDDASFRNQLVLLRKKIDKIDYEILELLAERNKLVEGIGHYKKANNVSVFQPERWEEIVQTRNKYGKEIALSNELINDLIQLIHRESIGLQNRIMNKD